MTPYCLTSQICRSLLGGILLICSDGLWSMVSQDMLTKIILENQSPDKACQTLVDEANSAGGPDNITAILVQLA